MKSWQPLSQAEKPECRSYFYWSFDRMTLFDDKTKAQKLLSVKSMHFKLKSKMYKTADFYLNLLLSLELVTKGCQRRPMKCAHFMHFKLKCAFHEIKKILTRLGNSLVSELIKSELKITSH